jgi:leucine dehydrogenase
MVQRQVTGQDFLESFHVIDDTPTGVTGVIAIHSTALGPAAGGCRFWHYESREGMTRDAVRLARGMSYKNALAGLPFGGGKAVLQCPAGAFDRAVVFRVFADAVAALEGRYITAEDVGTTVTDMKMVQSRTPFVAGLDPKPGRAGGDPSPWTALGVFQSMQAAASFTYGSDVRGLTVAVQGTGNVGAELARLLAQAGARLIVADVDKDRAAKLAAELDAKLVDALEIVTTSADILAPCALGAVLNETTIPQLKVGLICGGANNQLATDADGHALRERGIVYCPDYLINAGGIINVTAEYLGETTAQVMGRVGTIAGRLATLLVRAREQGQPTHVIADAMAEQIMAERSLAAA